MKPRPIGSRRPRSSALSHARAAAFTGAACLALVASPALAADNGTPWAPFMANLAPGLSDAAGNPAGAEMSALQPDGKLVVVGGFDKANGVASKGIARFNVDGTVDTAFAANLGTGFAWGNNAGVAIRAVVIQPDGKIVVAGTPTTFDGTAVGRVVRLNADGTADASFNTNAATALPNTVNYAYGLALQADTSQAAGFWVVVVGNYLASEGAFDDYVVRLSEAGAADSTCRTDIGTGPNARADVVLAQPQSSGADKVVLIGDFTSVNADTNAKYVTRLNADCSVDTAFATNVASTGNGSGFNARGFSGAIQPDGKVVVGGNFTELSGSVAGRIARLGADGVPDTAFITRTGTGFNDQVAALAVQGDGGILASGALTALDGTTSTRLARIAADGTPDTGFSANVGLGFNGLGGRAVVVRPDAKFLVSGFFGEVNGLTFGGLAEFGPGIDVAPASTDFGSQEVSSASAARPVTVTSTGLVGLTVPRVSLTGANAGDFRIVSQSCTSLSPVAPGATCTAQVAFTPGSVGAKSASVSFESTANGSPQEVALLGTAFAVPVVPKTTPAQITAQVLIPRTQLRSGHRTTLSIRTANTGGAAASRVRSCLVVPANLVIVSARGALRSGRTVCFSATTIAPGAQVTRSIVVRAVSRRTVTRRVPGSARMLGTGSAAVAATPVAVRITPRVIQPPVVG